MHTILLVGAGQLGSRYIQGLAHSKIGLNIFVVDPSNVSLMRAKNRWIEEKVEKSQHKILWSNELPLDLLYVDIAIVATSSNGRPDLIKNIASKFVVKYWILEKVLAQSISELNDIQTYTDKSLGCWVNTPRRMMEWHKLLKSEFSNKGPITGRLSGSGWGLACNSIHFIDLFSWWTEEEVLRIDVSDLDQQWFEGKRQGYFEINGIIKVFFKGGSTLILDTNALSNNYLINIKFENNLQWTVDEYTGEAFSSCGKKSIFGKLELQSSMTAHLVDMILQKGSCELPDLTTSVTIHSILIESLLSHWNKSTGCFQTKLPIT